MAVDGNKIKVTNKILHLSEWSEVRIAYDEVTGKKLACKIIYKKKIVNNKILEAVSNELKIHKKLNHPNIIKIYHYAEDEDYLILFMEYGDGGDLLEYLVRHGELEESSARDIFKQLLDAISYLHNRSIVHRDLKPENFLIYHDKYIKIADFGLSTKITPDSLLEDWCGSPIYSSPELASRKPYIGTETDVWALGISLYMMLTGTQPFYSDSLTELFNKIMTSPVYYPDFLSDSSKDLLSKMLEKDSSKRITVENILQHPWLHNRTLM